MAVPQMDAALFDITLAGTRVAGMLPPAKAVTNMNQEDIEKILGAGVPVLPGDVWLSRLWKCSQCDTNYEARTC